MTATDLILHLLGFVAPAMALAVLVALAASWMLPGTQRPSWWVSVALNFIAGVAALGIGLWFFGRDGKMATYAALVLAVAACQWVAGRGWRAQG